jgi:hypothetical protein
MQTKRYLLLLILFALTAPLVRAQTNSAVSLSGTQWKGIYGSGTQANIAATLQISSQNGSLVGILSYDGYQETVAITAIGPGSFGIKGVSYKDLRGGRRFYLDNFKAQITPDGGHLNATGGDANSVVANEWLKLQKVELTAGGAPQPASPNLAKSLIGSNWNGAIAESQKGGTPAQLRIVQQNGGLNAILDYENFEEVLAITLTAPSNIQMRGVSYRDLGKLGPRGFTLDTAQGEISPDGRGIQGVIHGRHFDFRRLN